MCHVFSRRAETTEICAEDCRSFVQISNYNQENSPNFPEKYKVSGLGGKTEQKVKF